MKFFEEEVEEVEDEKARMIVNNRNWVKAPHPASDALADGLGHLAATQNL
jgi:hypothetical protein